ncbi:hypothetical protein VM1G_12018 [Cytospora mali]|uniref:Uncharacterized protein n=1 Tax=Cytospora mali TaxID=578113 RepID=A0A194VIH0_CYTMA|nr:hypothetical protein VM1G_12018 [Valsa mali]
MFTAKPLKADHILVDRGLAQAKTSFLEAIILAFLMLISIIVNTAIDIVAAGAIDFTVLFTIFF